MERRGGPALDGGKVNADARYKGVYAGGYADAQQGEGRQGRDVGQFLVRPVVPASRMTLIPSMVKTANPSQWSHSAM